jgi:ATP-binding cassette, subfamily B, bacterial MsbA
MRSYWRYIAYVWRYKIRVILSIVSSLVAEGLDFATVGAFLVILEVLLTPRMTGQPSPLASSKLFENPIGQWILDYLNSHRSPDSLLVRTMLIMNLWFLFLVFVRGSLDFLREYLLQSANVRGWTDMTTNLYERVLGLPMRYFTKHQLGGTLSTFGADIGELRNGGRGIFRELVRAPFELLLGLGATLVINWWLWLVTFVALPVIVYFIRMAGAYSRRYTRKSLEKRADAMSILAESVQGAAVIKAYDAEAYEWERFAAAANRMQHYSLRHALVRAIARPGTEFIYWVCRTVVALLGIHLVLRGVLSMSALFFFLFCIRKVYDPLSKLRDLWSEVQDCRAAAERVFGVMDLPREIIEKPDAVTLPPFSSEIRFDHVSFAYDPPQFVVRDFDLTVHAGEVVAIVGENGSGKSTVVSLLMRFYDPTEGAITIDGHDLRDLTFASLRRQIGYVAQTIFLVNDTVRRNIAFGRPEHTDAQIVAAAKAAQAHDFIIRDLPNGYDTEVGEGGAKLSGGQRQRVALARAVLRNPPILVLDEATSALDVDAEEKLQQELDRFAEGRTVILVSHRFSALRMADRTVVMANGRIESIGTHAELLESSPTYRNLHGKQSIVQE